MTRPRIYGTESPFCEWMRGNYSLPSTQFVATDVDLWVHAYRTSLDNKKQRDVQCIQFLEVKTRRAKPVSSQLDTLWKIHKTISSRTIAVGGNKVRNFGVSFVSLSGVDPARSDLIEWGRFCKDGSIKWTLVSVEKLESLMLCEHDPQTLESVVLRTHHKTRTHWQIKKAELGFTVAEQIVERS